MTPPRSFANLHRAGRSASPKLRSLEWNKRDVAPRTRPPCSRGSARLRISRRSLRREIRGDPAGADLILLAPGWMASFKSVAASRSLTAPTAYAGRARRRAPDGSASPADRGRRAAYLCQFGNPIDRAHIGRAKLKAKLRSPNLDDLEDSAETTKDALGYFATSLLTSALSPVPLWLRLAGGTGGISL